MPPLSKGMIRRRAARVLMGLTLCLPGLAGAALAMDVESPHPHESPTYQQIDPGDPLARHFGEVSDVSSALVAVPDPRVPRHRRAYDLSIVALIQGMIDAGYVLDRYTFPWEKALGQTGDAATGSTLETDDCQFGLMIFRRDAWRESTSLGQAAAPSLRALYLVPETNTYGLPRGTMFAAMAAIARQRSGRGVAIPAGWCPADPEKAARPKETVPASQDRAGRGSAPTAAAPPKPPSRAFALATHSHCDEERVRRDGKYLLLLGPSFSGSMDSLAQTNRVASRAGLPRVCAVSASATASSNDRILAFPQPLERSLEFHRIANDDEAKLAGLWHLAERIDADEGGRIAILSEATVFGHEICPLLDGTPLVGNAELRRRLCASAVKISFPSNIADVRAGLPRKTARSEDLQAFIPTSRSLPLDDGIGSGSEFPDSLQSKLTTAGTELELKKAIRMLAVMKPRLIIVVATDVRDRLFLFDMLREGVPYAQLADMELDLLMTHPNYIHATRGAVLVGSERTTAKVGTNDWDASSYAVSSTDYQGLLRKMIRGVDSPVRVARGGCPHAGNKRVMAVDDRQPILHVVGREGVVPLDCLSWKGHVITSWLTPLLGLLAILLLMYASPPMHALVGRAPVPGRFSRWVCRKLSGWIQIADPAINLSMGSLLVGMACLLLAAFLGGGKSALVIALIAVPALCWALAYQAGTYEMNNLRVRRLHFNERLGGRLARHWLSVLALLLLFLLAGWWAWQEIRGDQLTVVAIARLAYRTDQGLAIGVAMAVAVLGLLFTDNALAVARSASQRNHYVVLDGLWAPEERTRAKSQLGGMFAVGVFPCSSTMAVGLLVLLLCVVMAVPLKTGLFGEFLSVLALVAVIALSLVALAFLANAVRLRQRAVHVCRVLRALGMRSQDARERAPNPEGALGLWPPAEAMDIRFATTPAAARIKDAGPEAMQLLGPGAWVRFANALSLLRSEVRPFPKATRVAVYVLLASEVSQTRWATFSSAACSLGVAAFVYLYPVSGANGFALFALGLLIVNGLFAGYSAMSFERDEVMSNILCNRTAKVEFSATLFNYTAFPFVVLAISLAIVQIPGVLDWSEGLFKTLLNVSSGKAWG